MTTSCRAGWESLSTEQKLKLTGLESGCQARHERLIEVGFPASLPEVSSDDPTVEEASDDEPAPPTTPVHVGFTLEWAQMHFNAVMPKKQPAPRPISVFRQT